jgi:hypothetical protein
MQTACHRGAPPAGVWPVYPSGRGCGADRAGSPARESGGEACGPRSALEAAGDGSGAQSGVAGAPAPAWLPDHPGAALRPPGSLEGTDKSSGIIP